MSFPAFLTTGAALFSVLLGLPHSLLIAFDGGAPLLIAHKTVDRLFDEAPHSKRLVRDCLDI